VNYDFAREEGSVGWVGIQAWMESAATDSRFIYTLTVLAVMYFIATPAWISTSELRTWIRGSKNVAVATKRSALSATYAKYSS
jgi:hypothetical protein